MGQSAQSKLKPEQQCGATIVSVNNPRGTGGTCQQPKGFGTDHPGYGNCRYHGGRTQSGKIHAARERAQEIAADQKQRFGGMRVTNVVAEQVLLEEVARSAAMVRFLEDKISQWPAEFKTGTGLPRLVEEHYGANTVTVSESERRAWLYEYRQERKHLVEVTKSAISAKLSERVVSMAETQGYLFAQMLRATFAEIHLTAEQARKVQAVMPRILREAASGDVVIAGEIA